MRISSVWQLLHPAQPGGRLETFIHPLPGRFSQPRRPDKIPGCDGVVKRRAQVAVLFMPLAGAQVEFGEFFGFSQALAQQIAKEMVIAVPAPLVIQRDDEQVGAFEIFQGFLPGSRRSQRRTASHSGPHRRSRMDVRSKKVWTLSDCCCRTSSIR